MKKSVLYTLVTLLVLASCSMNDDPIETDNSEFFEEYFTDWDITIPYQNVSQTETYKLLQSLIDDIDENQIKLIISPNNDLNYQSVTKFNEYLGNNKVATTLLKRKDCVSVLISTYLTNLKTRDRAEMEWRSVIFEKVLASDMFVSKMNITEKIRLMILALSSDRVISASINDGVDVKYFTVQAGDIMIAIMLSSNYTPFVEDIKPVLEEASMGASYYLESLMPDQANDLVNEYAKKFINDNKKLTL